MTGPSWLAAIVGWIMIVVAVWALARILVAGRTGKVTDYEVDAHHTLMGVSMAGMLIPGLDIVRPGQSTGLWLIAWIGVAIWFTLGVIGDTAGVRRGGQVAVRHLPYLIMSAAMVYILAARSSGSMRAMSGKATGMGMGAALVPVPTLDLLFLLFMVGYAVLAIDRLPFAAAIGAGGIQHAATAQAKPATLLAPHLGAATNAVMAISMGYMLAMMLA